MLMSANENRMNRIVFLISFPTWVDFHVRTVSWITILLSNLALFFKALYFKAQWTLLWKEENLMRTLPVILQRRGATSKSFGTQLTIPSSTLLHTQVWKWRSEAQQNVEEPLSSSVSSSSKPALDPPQLQNSSSEEGIFAVDYAANELVGEDAGVFDVTSQKTSSWLAFTAILGVVLAILYVTWIDPQTGYGGAYIDAISSLTSNHEVRFLILRMYILHSTGHHVLVVIRPSNFCGCVYFWLDDGGTYHS